MRILYLASKSPSNPGCPTTQIIHIVRRQIPLCQYSMLSPAGLERRNRDNELTQPHLEEVMLGAPAFGRRGPAHSHAMPPPAIWLHRDEDWARDTKAR